MGNSKDFNILTASIGLETKKNNDPQFCKEENCPITELLHNKFLNERKDTHPTMVKITASFQKMAANKVTSIQKHNY